MARPESQEYLQHIKDHGGVVICEKVCDTKFYTLEGEPLLSKAVVLDLISDGHLISNDDGMWPGEDPQTYRVADATPAT